jgi:hypothetical protein
MYQSEATCQPVDCFKYKLALYKSSSACWRVGLCTMSYYEKEFVLATIKLKKIVHFALNTIIITHSTLEK